MHYKNVALEEIDLNIGKGHKFFDSMAKACLADMVFSSDPVNSDVFASEQYRLEAVERDKRNWLRFRKAAKIKRGEYYRSLYGL